MNNAAAPSLFFRYPFVVPANVGVNWENQTINFWENEITIWEIW